MKSVILAGGMGKRMGRVAEAVPKPMMPAAGKPILEHLILMAHREGFREFILLVGHMGDVIEDYFGDGRSLGVEIRYHRESSPLGTSGAVKAVADRLDDDFLVLYGDTVADLDLHELVSHHRRSPRMATIVVHPNDHPADSDLVDIDETGRIAAFHKKPHPEGAYCRNLASAALYVFSPRILPHLPTGKALDLGGDILPELILKGKDIYAYVTTEYIKDAGTPSRLSEVEEDILSGRVRGWNRRNRRKAVFLDRDGVLNVQRDRHVCTPGELELLPGVPAALRRINRSGYIAVLVTNQPAVAQGTLSPEGLDRIHRKLDTVLGAEGAYLDRIYFCPHHPDGGFPGERPEHKIPCACRKPATGLIEKATSDLNIDLSGSYLIGDRTVDIQTGINAGCRTILVAGGSAGMDGKYPCKADFEFESLADAVDFIIDRSDE